METAFRTEQDSRSYEQRTYVTAVTAGTERILHAQAR